MKWGVRHDKLRKKQMLADGYHLHNIELRNRNRGITTEGQKLINKSKGMKKDFGSYKNVDDEEYFEFVARTQHHLDTSNYWNHVNSRNVWLGNMTKDDKKRLHLGKKYAQKGFGTVDESDPRYR